MRLSQHLSSSDWQITSGNGACFPARRSPRLSHGVILRATSKRVDAPTTGVASAPTPVVHRHAQRIRRLAVYAVTVMALLPTPNIPASLPTSKLSESSPTTWLERINFFRSGSGLDPIRENSRLSAGATAHARYLLLNFREEIRSLKPMSPDAYQEKPGQSGYSAKGASAARNLQLAWGCNLYDAGQQIDHWIESLFIASPCSILTDRGRLRRGPSDGCWVATLRLSPPPEKAKPYPGAIEFPPAGAAVALDWLGLQAPDPLASCPGYARPVGLPITLQIGRDADAKLSAHSLTQDGKPIESCAFDAPSYRNPDPTAHEYGQLESARRRCGGNRSARAV